MRVVRQSPLLLGRAGDAATLDALLDEVSDGIGRVALIEGEAGIGKTSLLARVLESAAEREIVAFVAAAEELERDRPFGALAGALGLDRKSTDPERAEIGRLISGEAVPSLPLGQVPELRFRVIDAIISLIDGLSAAAPVLLAIEDLHWADPSTLLALHHVIRRETSHPVAIIGTLRPTPRSAELDRLVEIVSGGAGVHVQLSPLDPGAVAALTEQTVGAPPQQALLASLASAGGNPFYLTELLAALAEEGAISVAGGVARSREVVLPTSLRLIILRRLTFLSEDVLESLRVASVLGSSFTVSDLSVATGKPATELIPPVRHALSAGVLGEAGERLVFRHDLVRDAIYLDLPLAVRAALHLQVGRALAAADAPAAHVASHLALGASPGDADAVAWLRKAAQQAAPRAPTIALDLLEKALGLCLHDDPQRDEILAEYVWAHVWSGRPGDAESLARDLLVRDHDVAIGRALRHALGVVLWLEGKVADSQAQFESLLEDPDLPETDRSIVLARLCLRRLLSGDFRGAEEAALEAQASGERAGYDLAVAEALGALCWVAAARGDLREGIDLGRRAIAVSSRNEKAGGTFIQPRLYPQSRVYLGAALLDADLIDEAEQTLQEGRRLAENQGAHWSLPVFHTGLGFVRYERGNWDDALAEIETSLTLADEVGTRNGTVFAYSLMAHIALYRDDLEAARDAVEAADREIAAVGAAQFRLHWAMRARALLNEATGDVASALAILQGAWQLVTQVGMVMEHRELGLDIVRIACDSGSADTARSVVEALEDLAPRADVASARAAALLCRAYLDGDPDAASAAVAEYRETPRVIDRALATDQGASILLRAGRRDGAVALYEEASATYERIGATRLTSRVDAALRSLGVKRGKKGPRVRSRVGWGSLTQTEIEVVKLAAQGLTNREIGHRLFVSRRTVETHLSHVFGKLGVATRVQLAVEAARAGIGPAD
jgi:ATP/maltotriose-dependent transcriptional regulator MalT